MEQAWKRAVSRRELAVRLAGVVLLTSVAGVGRAILQRQEPSPYTKGVWLAGDHHIHTRYSPDGQYAIEEQVAHAASHGLNWCVITDHGSKNHDKVVMEMAYPALVEARRKHPEIMVFQGLEWNIPAGEHGSIIVPVTKEEAKQVTEFEARFDERNETRPDTPANKEPDAVSALKYMQTLKPRPLFFANHPARRGLDSPHEMRAWSDAGPDVTRGFEGAPGHQAATLVGGPRGAYGMKPNANSFPGYPEDSYRSWGGYDWYTSEVGGVWDSLLGEGRRWYITVNSDSHQQYRDRTIVDTSTYATKGYVTPTEKKADKETNEDFFPGEYAKTWVFASKKDPGAVLDAMRGGNMFTVFGDLIDRCELYAVAGRKTAPMGGTLKLARTGDSVTIRLRVHVPDKPNFAGKTPKLDHIDIIVGEVNGKVTDPDTMKNPSTRVAATLKASEAERDGEYLVFTHQMTDVHRSVYIRARGTNTDVTTPKKDTPDVDPWEDLWFYTNPVTITVGR